MFCKESPHPDIQINATTHANTVADQQHCDSALGALKVTLTGGVVGWVGDARVQVCPAVLNFSKMMTIIHITCLVHYYLRWKF